MPEGSGTEALPLRDVAHDTFVQASAGSKLGVATAQSSPAKPSAAALLPA